MQTALYQLAEDFLSTIVFLIVYFVTGQLCLAVTVAIAVGLGQFVVLRRGVARRTSWAGSALGW